MRNLRKPYQMYVLNLDAGRIFWLTAILLLLVALSFISGFFVGQDKIKIKVNNVSQRNKDMMDEILNKMDDKDKIDDEDYQFYEMSSPKKIIDRKESDPDYEYDPKGGTGVMDRDFERRSEPVIRKETIHEPVMAMGDKNVSSKKPYTVQVASYKRYSNAKVLQNDLRSEQFPAYIIKSDVSGFLYYRVRIGPFASRTLSLKVLEMVKRKKDCGNSFITSK
ncbi:MAG: SPOR domain-containing protein [Spirochaetes bacterium]|nr:SPOR domain-containing protein [Spirochaetota bacterium]